MARKLTKKAYNFNIKKRWYFIALMVFLMTVGIRPDENFDISAQEQEESDADYFVEEGQNAIFPIPTELKENVEFWKRYMQNIHLMRLLFMTADSWALHIPI